MEPRSKAVRMALDVEKPAHLYAITLPPPFVSLIASDILTAGEPAQHHPRENWPPWSSRFFSFRIMVDAVW